ncbi:MAG: aminotransferase class I/II-fold pyridoxal phosphate-dependent enzyme [Pseudomonadota bacterium]|nr:aminotransferase class I/II-fold pyridoxal phosphate-dependent enzyme [Pseudomonadota bacterium]
MRPIDPRPLADRLQTIPPFRVMEVVRIAEELESRGVDVIHLEVGEPDFPTSSSVIERACTALETGKTRYTDSRGVERLRDALSVWYQSHGLEVPARRIQITMGASAGLLLASAATTNPGDGVLMADPAYPCNPRFVEAVGGEVHWITTDVTTRFQPTCKVLEAEAAARDRTLMLAHPANPTGQAVPRAELEQMIHWCLTTHRHLIVDEIYQSLAFNDALRSSLTISDQHFVVGSFSKYFNMTGWRLGWLVIPEYALEATQRLAQHLFICAPSFAQEAALACFESEALQEAEVHRRELKARRDLLIPRLEAMGFQIAAEPDGAFYVFVDASDITSESQQFCADLIRKTGVAITPGIDFSHSLPPTWLRIAYTQPADRLLEALDRMAHFIND